ncbi:hypothetical protein G6L37_05730 [Agrobacterium rubi]|nr:hypothetical protein [Agrobacterium rubi]NTF24859.1 hypothetical protein [Agrobacterium rubi]
MTDPAELFDAFGFERLQGGLWRFAKHFENHPEAPDKFINDTAVLIVEEKSDGSFVGHVPFIGECSMDLADVPERSLFFKSADPRDMIALAQNEIGSSFCETTGEYPDEGFTDAASGTFITFPFMSDPWGDYAVTRETEQVYKSYELASPSDVFEGYVQWRDEFCARSISTRPSSSKR